MIGALSIAGATIALVVMYGVAGLVAAAALALVLLGATRLLK